MGAEPLYFILHEAIGRVQYGLAFSQTGFDSFWNCFGLDLGGDAVAIEHGKLSPRQ